MSRCFPYPPPGYEKNGISDEALIESIKKRQREEEKARKEKKKEGKREKKEKDRSGKNGESEKKKHRHKKEKSHKDEKDQEGQKIQDNNKKRTLETENLEKSNLTEEHGQPVGPQNSSDSTLNSNNKRHKPNSPPESDHNSGSIIRIRLPLQRHKDPEMCLPIKEQPCPAPGRTGDTALIHRPRETPLKQFREQIEKPTQPCSTSQNASQDVKNFRLTKEEHNPSSKLTGFSHKAATVSPPGKEKPNQILKTAESAQKAATVPPSSKEKQNHHSTSVDIAQKSATVLQPSKEKQNQGSSSGISPMVESLPTTSKSSSRRKQRVVSQFNDLFENWAPPPVQDDCFGDEKWLLETKHTPSNGDKVCETDNGVETYGPPASLWPRAHFLAAADVFALPYAVPF